MGKRQYTFRKRRDGKGLIKIGISATDIFIDDLDKLSELYNIDKAITLTMVIEQTLNSPEVFRNFKKFFNDVFKTAEGKIVKRYSIYQYYRIDQELISQVADYLKKIDSSGTEISRSHFLRALVHYFRKIKIDNQDKKLKEMIEHIKKNVSYEVKDTTLTESGLHVVFEVEKK